MTLATLDNRRREMMKADTPFAEITFSPDDDDKTGKGWYAQTINRDGSPAEESGLFMTKQEAVRWCKDRGATKLLTDNA